MKRTVILQEVECWAQVVAYFLSCDKKGFRKGSNSEIAGVERGGTWQEVNREDFSFGGSGL